MDDKKRRDIAKCRDFYLQKPDAPLVMREFGWYTLDRWEKEGHIRHGEDMRALFVLDEPGNFSVQ